PSTLPLRALLCRKRPRTLVAASACRSLAEPRPAPGRRLRCGSGLAAASIRRVAAARDGELRLGRCQRAKCMSWWVDELRLFFVALQFLTRLPAPRWVGH